MPYDSNQDLPPAVTDNLPDAAQSIWRSAFNSAIEQGQSEESAFRIAWNAVKDAGYYQDDNGNWRKRTIYTKRRRWKRTDKATVTQEEFPEGVVCWVCDKPIEFGQDYWYAPADDLMAEDDSVPIYYIVCEEHRRGDHQPDDDQKLNSDVVDHAFALLPWGDPDGEGNQLICTRCGALWDGPDDLHATEAVCPICGGPIMSPETAAFFEGIEWIDASTPMPDPGPPPRKTKQDDRLSDGVVICFGINPDVAEQLALGYDGEGAEQAEDLHVTLAYMGVRGEDVTDEEIATLHTVVNEWAATQAPLIGRFGGMGRFYGEEQDALVILLDVPGLDDFRASLMDAVRGAGMEPFMNHSYTPHVTVAYLAPDETADFMLPPETLTFDKVWVWVGTDHTAHQIGDQENPGDADQTHDYGEARERLEVKVAGLAYAGYPFNQLARAFDLPNPLEAWRLTMAYIARRHTPAPALPALSGVLRVSVGPAAPVLPDGPSAQDLLRFRRLPHTLRWRAMKAAFTDRYGGNPPDPETVCRGQCEGMGVIPLGPGSESDEEPWASLYVDALQRGAVDADGWAFVTCPDCNGTGVRSKVSDFPFDPYEMDDVDSDPSHFLLDGLLPVRDRSGTINSSAVVAATDVVTGAYENKYCPRCYGELTYGQKPCPHCGLEEPWVDIDRHRAAIALREVYREMGEAEPAELVELTKAVELVPRGFLSRRDVAKALQKQDGEVQRYTFGPVYAPNIDDAHGEFVDAPTLERAAREYAKLGDLNIYLQHTKKIAGVRTDWVVWPYEVTAELVLPDGSSETHTFPAGTVFMGVEWDEAVWPMVEEGRITGYSLGGTARTNRGKRLEVVFS